MEETPENSMLAVDMGHLSVVFKPHDESPIVAA
jgi:hypothetical protein